MTKFTTWPEGLVARIRFGGGGTSRVRWRAGAAGGRKLRKSRAGRIDRRLGMGHLGSSITTISTTRFRHTGLGWRWGRNGRGFREAALGRRATATVRNSTRYWRGGIEQSGRRFGNAFRAVLGIRSGGGSMSRVLGTEIATEQRGRLQRQGVSSPGPCGGQAAVVARIRRCSKKAQRPGAFFLPQLYSMSFASGIPSCQIAGRRRHMGEAGAARTLTRLHPLDHFSLTPLMGPRAGSRKASQNMTIPFASVEKDFGRLIVRDREAQLGVGRNAGRIAHLPREAKGFLTSRNSALRMPGRAASRSDTTWE